MTSSPQVEWVTEDIIRREFNERQFYEKVLSGEFSSVVKKERMPTLDFEPNGTLSQMVYYYDAKNQLVALVHQYLRPDGSLGGSGKPDPKKLYLGNRILATRSHPPKSRTT